jgi:hypothetical protein
LRMKKTFILVVILALATGMSCKKKPAGTDQKAPTQPIAKTNTPAPAPEQPAKPDPAAGFIKPGEGKVIQPESYFKFENERLTLFKEYKAKLLNALKAAGSNSDALKGKMVELNRAASMDFLDLAKKHTVTAVDIKRTREDAGSKKALDEYGAKHTDLTEIKKQLEVDIVNLDESINKEMKRLGINNNSGAPAAKPKP